MTEDVLLRRLAWRRGRFTVAKFATGWDAVGALELTPRAIRFRPLRRPEEALDLPLDTIARASFWDFGLGFKVITTNGQKYGFYFSSKVSSERRPSKKDSPEELGRLAEVGEGAGEVTGVLASLGAITGAIPDVGATPEAIGAFAALPGARRQAALWKQQLAVLLPKAKAHTTDSGMEQDAESQRAPAIPVSPDDKTQQGP